MVGSNYRFHGLGSLKFVLGKGSSVRSGSLQLKFIENKRRQSNRVAVVVAKKVSKKAPVRNRIRRRVYETVRLQLPLLKEPFDLVLSVFDEGVATSKPAQLNRQIVELLHKANLYKD